jgi:hypothetical protein
LRSSAARRRPARASAPRPRLNRTLTQYQPILDGLLAVDRFERFQSAAEVVAAFEALAPR